MRHRKRYNFVLSIYLDRRGFGFVLFEGPLSPIDWGTRESRGEGRNQRCLIGITALLERYRPDALVLQDTTSTGTRRNLRVQELNACVAELAESYGISTHAYSREQVREAFGLSVGTNKHQIAETIAKHIPAFERYLPPPRKPWMAEYTRMSLFDAAALALTFYQDRAGPGLGTA